MWATKLKIAIIEKDADALDKLLNEMPAFNGLDDVKEIEEAMFLLREASILAYALKDETAASMKLIKQNLLFLKATQEKPLSSLNISS
jgi:squalene cyclase